MPELDLKEDRKQQVEQLRESEEEQEEEGGLGHLVLGNVPVVQEPGRNGGEVGVVVTILAVIFPSELTHTRGSEQRSDGLAAVLTPPVLAVQPRLVTYQVQTPGKAQVLGQ